MGSALNLADAPYPASAGKRFPIFSETYLMCD